MNSAGPRFCGLRCNVGLCAILTKGITMSEHAELMKQMHMERRDYLSALRKDQPIDELERKATKAKRRGIYTQEELDLSIARGMNLAMQLIVE